MPAVGHIVGALWELRDLAGLACGNRANCATLDAFGADILRAFDFHGAHLRSASSSLPAVRSMLV